MGYTLLKSFERGIDARKLIDTTEPGTLLEGRDCHITLGGEIEKRAAFVLVMSLPATTRGLYVAQGRVIHTWGDTVSPGGGLPPGVVYHYVPHRTGEGLLAFILSVEEFNSKLYVVVRYANDDVYHWWDDKLVVIEAAPVTTPAPGEPEPPPPPTTVEANKPAVTVTFAFTATGTPPLAVHLYSIYLVAPNTTYNFGPTGTIDAFMLMTANTPVGGRPAGDIQIESVEGVNGIAAAVMDEVNSSATTPKVQAQASGASVRFWIDQLGILYNGWRIEFRTGGIRTLPLNVPYVFEGGRDPPPPVLRASGTPVPTVEPVIGDPVDKGYFAIAHNKRIFSVQEEHLNYSAPKLPTLWHGVWNQSGEINHSMITSRRPLLMSLADYGGNLAVFGVRHIFVWKIDADPERDQKLQTLHGTGTFAPHSVVPYGQSDVMYLDTSGIRSLRARDSSEQAFAADIGNLIDDLVRAKIATLSDRQKLYMVWGIVEPRSGRLWMALYDKIFVLSYYPSSRVAAWTWYELGNLPVDMMVSSDNSVYWRSGNSVMVYGGEEGTTYDDTEAVARLPYIDGGKPATSKNWTGIDLALFGSWQVRGSFDPTNPTALDLLANLTKSTYAQQRIAINGESPGLSLELRTTYVGPARIGNAAAHFTDSTAD